MKTNSQFSDSTLLGSQNTLVNQALTRNRGGLFLRLDWAIGGALGSAWVRFRMWAYGGRHFGHQLLCCLHNSCTRFNAQQTHRIVAIPCQKSPSRQHWNLHSFTAAHSAPIY